MDSVSSGIMSIPNQRLMISGVERHEAANRATGWDVDLLQMQRGSLHAEFSTAEVDGVRLIWERYDRRLLYSAAPPDGTVAIVVPTALDGECRAYGRSFGVGDLLIFWPGSEMDIATCSTASDLAITLDASRFAGLLRALCPASGRALPERRSGVLRGRRGPVELVRRAAVNLGQQPDLAPFREDVATLVGNLACLVGEAMGESSGSDSIRPVNESRVVNWARDFIEQNLSGVIRMERLSRYTGAGIRTLQRCFRQQLDTTPSDYIRNRRLNAARRLLASADPREMAVSTAAIDCGLTHFGRFSVQYKTLFGESPSETLRNPTDSH